MKADKDALELERKDPSMDPCCVEWVPWCYRLNSYVEVLTPSTLEYDCIWR